MINGVKRAEALRLMDRHQDLELTLDEAKSLTPKAAEQLLENIKPQRYVALARVIAELLDYVESREIERVYLEDVERDSPFEDLRSDTMVLFAEGIESIEGSGSYRKAEQYTKLVGTLDENRYVDLHMQLFAGSGTAVTAMAKFLEQIPAIARYYDPEVDSSNFRSIARSSIGLPWKLAMISVNQLMAARTALADKINDVPWTASIKLNPIYFKPVMQEGKIKGLKFDNLEALSVPGGYTPLPYIPPLEVPTRIADIKGGPESTIGCPITLLPRRLHNLWFKMIEATEARGLWSLSL
jgi:hypothetical protein